MATNDLIDNLLDAAIDDLLDDFYNQPIAHEDHPWTPEPIELDIHAFENEHEEDMYIDGELGAHPLGDQEPEEGIYVGGVLVPFRNEAHDMQRLGKGFCVGPHCQGCRPLRGKCRTIHA